MTEQETEIKQLQDKIKQQEATIQALQGMLGQVLPVVEVLLPHLKNIPQINQDTISQVERMTQVARMMMTMGDING